ncbi:hypothetical protein BJ138DRAFT_423888 [Hygrophoropsis aurantiaca]|uniref:Uncharacterized protein n=1 Tax=Hygrophoropsis aurantiaca TaxID=72124 RepID=A0ACB8A3Z5_9AGAM|nr:hypothetical protein BJ138DRAFT_423888 [Hygrophoropsis aurantiaca]
MQFQRPMSRWRLLIDILIAMRLSTLDRVCAGGLIHKLSSELRTAHWFLNPPSRLCSRWTRTKLLLTHPHLPQRCEASFIQSAASCCIRRACTLHVSVSLASPTHETNSVFPSHPPHADSPS